MSALGSDRPEASKMAQFHWDPDAYLALMSEEIPEYERLQEAVAAAAGTEADRVLELGTGTGETARRVLAANGAALLVGVDESAEMLERARTVLPAERVQLVVGRLEDPLPDGRFDLVISALAVHHLDGPGKADLFRRVASVLAPGGRFVLGDVIVPVNPADEVAPIDGEYDTPSTIDEQLQWLGAAGLLARTQWVHRDLAVLVGEARPRASGS